MRGWFINNLNMETISVKTTERTTLIDITKQVQQVVTKNGWKNGLVHLYVPHTTAAITINENADPSVPDDIVNKLNQLVPHSGSYRHTEGNADAHIKSSLVGVTQMVAVANGRLVLGTWQGIFFCEFDGPRTRNVQLSFIGE